MSVPIKTDWKICRLSVNFMLPIPDQPEFFKSLLRQRSPVDKRCLKGFFPRNVDSKVFHFGTTRNLVPVFEM